MNRAIDAVLDHVGAAIWHVKERVIPPMWRQIP